MKNLSHNYCIENFLIILMLCFNNAVRVEIKDVI